MDLPAMTARARLTIATMAVAALPACRGSAAEPHQRAARRHTETASSATAAPPLASAVPSLAPAASGGDDGPELAPTRTAPSASAGASPGPPSSPWIIDEAADLGVGAPATAAPFGVVVNDREGDLGLARLGPLSRSHAPARAPLSPLKGTTGPLSLGRGPSVSGDAVYWISHGALVRRRYPAHGPPSSLEILEKDAHDGTRVAVPLSVPGAKTAEIPQTVSYIVRPDKEDGLLVAKLWVEGAEPLLLTAEGNSTHSVSLVRTEDGVLVVSVQARMAMTPVHARRVRFEGGKPVLGEDLVAWVGGGIQPLTEMTLLPAAQGGLFGFIPHERSITEFGVAQLDLGMHPTMDTKTAWLVYPNGIDPAPVAATHLCGEPVLLYAQPETALPDARQELTLRSLVDDSGKRAARIAEARAFYFVSIAEVAGGALAAWVTDEGLSSTTVRCTKPPK